MSASASVNLSTHTVPCCCLCLSSTSADHRNRKRLRMDTCAEAREVLVSLSGPFFLHAPRSCSCAMQCLPKGSVQNCKALSPPPRESG